MVRNTREQTEGGKTSTGLRLQKVYVCVTKGGMSVCRVWGSLAVSIQTPQLTDPETTDTSTKRQSTNSTLSFTITDNDRLHEGLNNLMVKMRRKDGSRE